ncbi:hypothetical protein B0T14DRAFT_82279 [Immersiella caudata]|uniref:Uncharacterized protein n=1 Tax=Immersiella caudata TaxID=314043 RepID=A0AA40CCV4_9PEZI|nr:hypothetical protein B0T14DRAFT_82279 [Immersiella caudata]
MKIRKTLKSESDRLEKARRSVQRLQDLAFYLFTASAVDSFFSSFSVWQICRAIADSHEKLKSSTPIFLGYRLLTTQIVISGLLEIFLVGLALVLWGRTIWERYQYDVEMAEIICLVLDWCRREQEAEKTIAD